MGRRVFTSFTKDRHKMLASRNIVHRNEGNDLNSALEKTPSEKFREPLSTDNAQDAQGSVVELSEEVIRRIGKAGVIPVVVIEDPSKATQLGKTILNAGLDLIEITMRTERAMDAVKILHEELPDLLVGAGTVFTVSTAKEAVSSGARFIVSPHLDEEITSYCMNHDIVCIPGAYTPTEIQRAIKTATKDRQVSNTREIPLAIKIFPASTGGPNHLKAMKAVFPQVRFVPLGGVNADNLRDYFKAGAWAVGGTWICRKNLIENDDYTRISELVREAVQLVKDARRNHLHT